MLIQTKRRWPLSSLLGGLAVLVTPLGCREKSRSGPVTPANVKPIVVATAAAAPSGPDVLQRIRAIGVPYYRLAPEHRLGEAVELVHVECVREEDEGRLRRVQCRPGKLLSAEDLRAAGADATLLRVAACTRVSSSRAPLEVVREVEKASMEDREVRLAGRQVVVRTEALVIRSYVHGPGQHAATTSSGGSQTVALPSRFVHPGSSTGEGFEAYVPARRKGDGTWLVDERFFPARGRKLGWRLNLDNADPTPTELVQAMSTLDVDAEGPFVRLAVYANRIYVAVANQDKPGALRIERDLSTLREGVARWPDSANRRYLLMFADDILTKLAGLARSDVSLIDPCAR